MRWFGLLTQGDDITRLVASMASWKFAVFHSKASNVSKPQVQQIHPAISLSASSHLWYAPDLPLHYVMGLRFPQTVVMSVLAVKTLELENLVDAHGHTPLHLAIIYSSAIPVIAQLVERYPRAICIADFDGLSPLAWSIAEGWNEERIVQLAVPLAKQILTQGQKLMDSSNYQGAFRLYQNAIESTFLSLSDYFQSPQVDQSVLMPLRAACEQLHEQFVAFVEKNHLKLESPSIDLEPMREIEVDISQDLHLQVCAKGAEPLHYQWYFSQDMEAVEFDESMGMEMPDHTSPELYIPSTILEHTGIYHCKVFNWKGSVYTSGTLVRILDEETLAAMERERKAQYRIDRANFEPEEVLTTIYRQTGGILECGRLGTTLFVPSCSFTIFDSTGEDVSDSSGLDMTVRVIDECSEEVITNFPELDAKDHFVSPVVRVRLPSRGARKADVKKMQNIRFHPPLLLRIPHCGIQEANTENRKFEFHVLQITFNLKKLKPQWTEVPLSQCTFTKHYVELRLDEIGNFKHTSTASKSIFVMVDRAFRKEFIPLRNLQMTAMVFTRFPDRETLQVRLCLDRFRPDVFHRVIASHEQEWKFRGICPLVLVCGTSIQQLIIDENERDLQCTLDVVDTPAEHDRKLQISRVAKALGLICMEIHLSCSHNPLKTREEIPLSLELPALALETSLAPAPTQPRVLLNYPRFLLLHQDPYSPSIEIPDTITSNFSLVRVEIAAFSKLFWDRYQNIWWFEEGQVPMVRRLYKPACYEMYEVNQGRILLPTKAHACAIRLRFESFEGNVSEWSKPLIVFPDVRGDEFQDEDEEDMRVKLRIDHLTHAFDMTIAYSEQMNTLLRQVKDSGILDWELLLTWINLNDPDEDLDQFFRAKSLEWHLPDLSFVLLQLSSQVFKQKVKQLPFQHQQYHFAPFLRTLDYLTCLFPKLIHFTTESTPVPIYHVLYETIRLLLDISHQIIQPRLAPGFIRYHLFKYDEASRYFEPIARSLNQLQQFLLQLPSLDPVELQLVEKTIKYHASYQHLNRQWIGRTRAELTWICEAHELLRCYFHRMILVADEDVVCVRLHEDLDTSMEAIHAELEICRDAIKYGEPLASHIVKMHPTEGLKIGKVNNIIHVTFDEEVVGITDPSGFLSVHNCTSDCAILGQVDYNESLREFTFTPEDPFERRSTIQFTLHADFVLNTLGAFTQNISITFHTSH